MAIAAILVVAVGCGKKKEEPVRELVVPETRVEPTLPKVATKPDPWLDAPRTPETPEVPPPPPLPPPVFPMAKLEELPADASVDKALQEILRVVREEAPELGLVEIDIKYVRKDGTLDPTYGELAVRLALSDEPDGIVDDPNRPTGAPVPEHKPVESPRTNCPLLKLSKGEWSLDEVGCRKTKFLAVRCPIESLWKQAIAEGAPENAVAILERSNDVSFWVFAVKDKIRKVDFKRYLYEKQNCVTAPAAGSGSGSAVKVKPNPYAQ